MYIYQHLYNILFYNTTAELVRHVQVQYISVYFLHMIQGKFPVDNLSKIILQLTKILNQIKHDAKCLSVKCFCVNRKLFEICQLNVE